MKLQSQDHSQENCREKWARRVGTVASLLCVAVFALLGLIGVLRATDIDYMRLDYVLIIMSVGAIVVGFYLLNKDN